MRQLTASQKIAILENRVAQLEKQAMFSFIKKRLENTVSNLKPLKVASSAMVQTGFKPKELVQNYKRTSNTREFKTLLKELQGKTKERKIYLLADMIKSKPESQKSAFLLGEYVALVVATALLWVTTDFLIDVVLEPIINKVNSKLENTGNFVLATGLSLTLAVAYLLYVPLQGVRMLLKLLFEFFAD